MVGKEKHPYFRSLKDLISAIFRLVNYGNSARWFNPLLDDWIA